MSRKLVAAVVDSSAPFCILRGEPAAPLFMAGFQRTGQLYIGAATRAETWLAAHNAKGKAGAQQIEALLEALLEALQCETVDFSASSSVHYRHGAENHHKVDAKARVNISTS